VGWRYLRYAQNVVQLCSGLGIDLLHLIQLLWHVCYRLLLLRLHDLG
jgi:hypothetical protein